MKTTGRPMLCLLHTYGPQHVEEGANGGGQGRHGQQGHPAGQHS